MAGHQLQLQALLCTANMACHQRSASLPSKPYSTGSKVEEELQGLKASISSPSATIGVLRDGLRRLGDVYSRIEEIMYLPSSQGSLRLQKKMAEEELDRSLAVMDLCSAMQESIAELKMGAQELQLVLKRGGADSAAVQSKIEYVIRLTKKVSKPFSRKSSSNKSGSDEGCCKLVRLLAEAREVASSLLESTAHLLPMQIAMARASRWSLVSKRLQKIKVVCEEEQLKALELSLEDLEDGTELLFKRLIQSRVSLLNILST